MAATRVARHMPAMKGIPCPAWIPATKAVLRRCDSARACGGTPEGLVSVAKSLRLCGTPAPVCVVSTDIMAGVGTP